MIFSFRPEFHSAQFVVAQSIQTDPERRRRQVVLVDHQPRREIEFSGDAVASDRSEMRVETGPTEFSSFDEILACVGQSDETTEKLAFGEEQSAASARADDAFDLGTNLAGGHFIDESLRNSSVDESGRIGELGDQRLRTRLLLDVDQHAADEQQWKFNRWNPLELLVRRWNEHVFIVDERRQFQ